MPIGKCTFVQLQWWRGNDIILGMKTKTRMVSKVCSAGVILSLCASALAYDDLPWKFEGSTVRVETSRNDGVSASSIETFVSSIKASSPLDWFSTIKLGLMLFFR